jgi:signal transduction histidine kinase
MATSSSRRPWSLRNRLALALVAGFALLLALASVLTVSLVADRVTAEFDAALLAKARALAALVDQEADRVDFDYTAQTMPEFEREQDPEHFQLWLDSGAVLRRSGRLQVDLPRADTPGNGPFLTDLLLPDGRPGRVAEIRFLPRASEHGEGPGEEVPASRPDSAPAKAVVLAVARSRQPVDQLLARVRLIILGTASGTALLAALLGWWALRWGMAPLGSLAAQVARLQASDLGTRVSLRDAPRELDPIVQQLNLLLQRLQTSFEQQRRFAGNVAHELRTPITELRTLADVAQRWPDDVVATTAFFADVGSISRRMERVVGDLLLLARCQAGVEGCGRGLVDLRAAVAAAWAPFSGTAAARGLRLTVAVADGTTLQSDSGKLGILLANLFDNAVTYALPRTEVLCRAVEDGATLRLQVANAAEPLSPAELRRTIEPFWRKDQARSSPRHAGLGLAIVSALAELLGLSLAIDQDTSGTFHVTLAGLVLLEAASGRAASA